MAQAAEASLEQILAEMLTLETYVSRVGSPPDATADYTVYSLGGGQYTARGRSGLVRHDRKLRHIRLGNIDEDQSAGRV